MPEGTTTRIRKAIAELHYEPNLHARRLTLGRTDTLALVLPDISDPFFAALAGAVEAAAEAAGYGLVLCSTRNRTEREVEYLGRVRRNHVDGVLFATNHPDDGRLKTAVEGQRGVVLLDEDVRGVTASRVFCDNRAGGSLATQLLIEAGHRRIGFIGGIEGVMSAVERADGYADALATAGITADPALISFGGYTAEHGASAMRAFLRLADPPTAVFASSDRIAIGALDVLRGAGLAVPVDISLVAYDDVAPFGLFLPAITAVRQPVGLMGEQGVAALVALLKDEARLPETIRLPVELMMRGSVAAPATHHDPSRQGARSIA